MPSSDQSEQFPTKQTSRRKKNGNKNLEKFQNQFGVFTHFTREPYKRFAPKKNCPEKKIHLIQLKSEKKKIYLIRRNPSGSSISS